MQIHRIIKIILQEDNKKLKSKEIASYDGFNLGGNKYSLKFEWT